MNSGQKNIYFVNPPVPVVDKCAILRSSALTCFIPKRNYEDELYDYSVLVEKLREKTEILKSVNERLAVSNAAKLELMMKIEGTEKKIREDAWVSAAIQLVPEHPTDKEIETLQRLATLASECAKRAQAIGSLKNFEQFVSVNIKPPTSKLD